MAFNDYLTLTKEYVKELECFRAHVQNLNITLQELEPDRGLVSPKVTAGYGQNPGGSAELTSTEAEANRKIENERQLERVQEDLRKMESQIRKIENSIGSLPDEESRALILHYSQGLTYGELAEKLGWSPRTCKRRVKEATRKVAIMMFGNKTKERVKFIE